MNSAEIRHAFLDYFQTQGHRIVASSPLVPGNDPTLLFTNAGMVQFKDVFLGLDKRPYNRAASSQRCVRAGGKHNDLENVGYTARHHTFFEMLGNFSFGDYFKHEAIRFAWDFLTVKLGIAPGKLWVTVFHEDAEAERIWLDDIKIDPARFSRLGEKDNFWAMGDTGPCGPCSEIFYDHGEAVPGGPPGSADADGDRYIEIWNLVFMQFNRSADGSMSPLPKPSVDTGMGLERIAAVMQGVHSNYEIDLFQALLKDAAAITGCENHNHTSLKVIADHIRSCAFLVTDGVLPSNEGRGYVLRRIIRRAIRHGHQLGIKEPFFHKLVDSLRDVMGQAYPELVEAAGRVREVLLGEERQFSRTLENGMAILEEAIANLDGTVLPGETVFKLYDTYGFPVDLTADIARERNLTIDTAGFEEAMQGQRQQARAASRFEAESAFTIAESGETRFDGYEQLQSSSTILGLYRNGQSVSSLQAGDKGVVILDTTAFYAESGGQVGDQGQLKSGNAVFTVTDTRKQGQHFLHHGKMESGTFNTGDALVAEVAADLRRATMLNHSATHLMHAALRQVLGSHVTQKGSLVHPDYLRFDFSHDRPVSPAELERVEALVNEQILANTPAHKQIVSLDEARKLGAMALFGEKYGDVVRVISFGKKTAHADPEAKAQANADAFSIELCGGTHVDRTGDIGLFKIIQESGIAAGVRRIEAVTGATALARIKEQDKRVQAAAALLRTAPDLLVDKVQQLVASQKQLEKEVQQLKSKLAAAASTDLVGQAEIISGIKVLASEVKGIDNKSLRDTADQLRSRLGSGVVVLALVESDKVNLVVAVSKDLTSRIKAGELINALAGHVGGKGGGRPDMAMAGGNKPEGLPQALAAVGPAISACV